MDRRRRPPNNVPTCYMYGSKLFCFVRHVYETGPKNEHDQNIFTISNGKYIEVFKIVIYRTKKVKFLLFYLFLHCVTTNTKRSEPIGLHFSFRDKNPNSLQTKMKLNAILISLFATVAYASKADIMALREDLRNAKVCLEFPSLNFISLRQNCVCVIGP